MTGVQTCALPILKGLKWNLSGSHKIDDECDLLAKADCFGLGAGVYPPDQCPVRPHPHCMCYLTDVFRPMAEWDKPKPEYKRRKISNIPFRFPKGMSNKRRLAVRQKFEEVVTYREKIKVPKITAPKTIIKPEGAKGKPKVTKAKEEVKFKEFEGLTKKGINNADKWANNTFDEWVKANMDKAGALKKYESGTWNSIMNRYLKYGDDCWETTFKRYPKAIANAVGSINTEALKSKAIKKLKVIINKLSKDIDGTMVKIKDNVILYRGANSSKLINLKVEQISEFDSYASTSLIKEAARGFIGTTYKDPILLNIKAQTGQKMVYVNKFTKSKVFAQEYECLLPKNTSFKKIGRAHV